MGPEKTRSYRTNSVAQWIEIKSKLVQIFEGTNIGLKHHLIYLHRHNICLTVIQVSPSLVVIRLWQESSPVTERTQSYQQWYGPLPGTTTHRPGDAKEDSEGGCINLPGKGKQN